jgi:hypothetical protein
MLEERALPRHPEEALPCRAGLRARGNGTSGGRTEKGDRSRLTPVALCGSRLPVAGLDGDDGHAPVSVELAQLVRASSRPSALLRTEWRGLVRLQAGCRAVLTCRGGQHRAAAKPRANVTRPSEELALFDVRGSQDGQGRSENGVGSLSVVVCDGREALQQGSKRGPRSCSPIFNRAMSLMNATSGPASMAVGPLGQFGRRSDCRGLVPAPGGN